MAGVLQGLANRRFSFVAIVLQAVILLLFAFCTEYERPEARPPLNNSTSPGNGIDSLYPMWQDVHGMMFIGFGFLMAFLKRYGYSSVGLNFFLGALVIQWATLTLGFFKYEYSNTIQLSSLSLLTADFAAAAVMISFGAVLGKVSILQLLVMAFLEIIIFSASEALGVKYWKAEDVGGSIFVHAFGAYFGLALSRTLASQSRYPRKQGSDKEGASYKSDLFSLFGTIVLWLYWPSFNAALKAGDERQRAVINTYYSLSACAVTTFALAALFGKKEKIDMVLVQNATLAGGVAVGASANFLIQPWAAQTLGCVASVVSVFGYLALQPALQSGMKIHDTCGVHNLHGMPGIVGALAGIAATAKVSPERYGDSLYSVYPAMAPSNSSDPELIRLASLGIEVEPGEGRTSGEQALFQLAALVTTLVIALAGGALTGLVLRCFAPPCDNEAEMFEDDVHWETNAEVLDCGKSAGDSAADYIRHGQTLHERLSPLQ